MIKKEGCCGSPLFCCSGHPACPYPRRFWKILNVAAGRVTPRENILSLLLQTRLWIDSLKLRRGILSLAPRLFGLIFNIRRDGVFFHSAGTPFFRIFGGAVFCFLPPDCYTFSFAAGIFACVSANLTFFRHSGGKSWLQPPPQGRFFFIPAGDPGLNPRRRYTDLKDSAGCALFHNHPVSCKPHPNN